MKLKKNLIGLFLGLILSYNLFPADVINIISNNSEAGTYELEINGKSYTALDEETMKAILKEGAELEAANKKIEALNTYIEQLEKLKEQFNKTLEAKNQYINLLEDVNTLYQKLTSKYKQLKHESILKIGIGGGYGGDFNPAAAVSVSLFNFQLTGFIQQSNPGILLQIIFPL